MTIEQLRESEAISLVLAGKFTPKELDSTIKNLRQRIKELEQICQLHMAENIRLRRYIGALEGD